MPDAQTFKEWLEKTYTYTGEDFRDGARAGFEAGRRAGLEEAAVVSDRWGGGCDDCGRDRGRACSTCWSVEDFQEEYGNRGALSPTLRALASAPIEAPAPGTGETSRG